MSSERRDQPQQIDRKLFGEGKIGEWAYATIKSGALCRVITNYPQLGTEKAIFCGKKAIGTLDFDDGGTGSRDTDLIPVCSDEHWRMAKRDITSEYMKDDRVIPSFGRNGIGRS